MMRSAALATFFGTLGGAQRIAVCFAGETRSLIEWPVVASFSQHIRPTLERVGGYDVFVVLSEDALDDSMRDAITSAYGAIHVSCAPNRPERIVDFVTSSTARRHRGCARGIVGNPNNMKVLRQFAAIAACYHAVTRHELAPRQRRYDWLYRLRTDLVLFSDIFEPPGGGNVLVASGGMTDNAGFRCMNDHVFACPRDLCGPHFRLLEIMRARGLSAICEDRPAAPRCTWRDALVDQRGADCAIEALPPGMTPQWFPHTLYDGTYDASGANASPCGIVRERDIHYTLARQKNGNHLQCKYRLEDLWRDKNAPQLGDFTPLCERVSERWTAVRGPIPF